MPASFWSLTQISLGHLMRGVKRSVLVCGVASRARVMATPVASDKPASGSDAGHGKAIEKVSASPTRVSHGLPKRPLPWVCSAASMTRVCVSWPARATSIRAVFVEPMCATTSMLMSGHCWWVRSQMSSAPWFSARIMATTGGLSMAISWPYGVLSAWSV